MMPQPIPEPSSLATRENTESPESWTWVDWTRAVLVLLCLNGWFWLDPEPVDPPWVPSPPSWEYYVVQVFMSDYLAIFVGVLSAFVVVRAFLQLAIAFMKEKPDR